MEPKNRPNTSGVTEYKSGHSGWRKYSHNWAGCAHFLRPDGFPLIPKRPMLSDGLLSDSSGKILEEPWGAFAGRGDYDGVDK